MKAFLLAGGRGERLKPLTLTVPKCLAPIGATPLLAVWLGLFVREGITDVLLNVSHHADQVRLFLERDTRPVSVRLVEESTPIGSAMTVARNRRFVKGEESFWILYADNLSDVPLREMAAAHSRHQGVLTMGLFRAEDPRVAGIAELDGRCRVTRFEEKPARPWGNLANAGVYLARQSVFDYIPRSPGIVDFGHHVLPRLVGRMYGHELTGFHADIGTPDALRRAADNWKTIKPAGSSA
jgi:mannose-1-phosphate guanylyltransferase